MSDVKIQKASELGDIQYITTGIKELDKIVQFPKGRVTEIYGLQNVGKTSLTLKAISGMQKENLKVLFIDVENALNVDWANTLGVDLEKLDVANAIFVEDVSDLVMEQCSKYDAIIVDSLAAMIPAKEQEGRPGDAHVGLKARLMGQFMRRAIKPIYDSGCALIFINQLRENLDMFSSKYTTPGGMAVKFAASLRIELKTTSKDRITRKGERVGHHVNATITKSKVGKPHQTTKFKLVYEGE